MGTQSMGRCLNNGSYSLDWMAGIQSFDLPGGNDNDMVKTCENVAVDDGDEWRIMKQYWMIGSTMLHVYHWLNNG